MGHIKTNKTLHLTEIPTFLKSFNNYLQSTDAKPSQTSSSTSFVKNNWFFIGLNWIISLQHLPRATLFELICSVYAVNRFSKHRRWTTCACIEFPGLYGDLQTDFQPIKFLETWSVWVGHVINSHTIWSIEHTDRATNIISLLLITQAYWLYYIFDLTWFILKFSE